jgi:hypothetical protein
MCKKRYHCAAFADDGGRPGLSLFEVVVACTLLTSVLSLSLSLLIREGRLLTAERNYRLALDEVSNQLDRLTGLPTNELPRALKRLTVSPFTAARLPGANLVGEMTPADIGHRVTLRLTYGEPHAQTVSMSSWSFSLRSGTGDQPTRGR